MSPAVVGCNGYPGHNSLHTDMLVAAGALEVLGDKNPQAHRGEEEAVL